MMNKRVATIAALTLAACQAPANESANSQHEQQPIPAAPAAAPAPAPAPAVPQASPVRNSAEPRNRQSLPEPNGPIDPRSVEAAGQVVQHFGALIESGRNREAEALWGDADAAAAFVKQLRPGTHLEIGDLGPPEGAAGSIYTTVPVVFYRDGFRKAAKIILRRVNDVPGSTAAERRWHIERIE
jgi:hypothetical protein